MPTFTYDKSFCSKSDNVKNIVVLASGSGSNFQSIIDSIERGTLNARIAGLIAGSPGIKAIERAQNHNIPVKVLSPSSEEQLSSDLLAIFELWKPDLIILAGFLKKIPANVVHSYRNQIINIHPSLLPKFGGKGFFGERVHCAVLDAGELESGCTVHYVNEQYDDGDIIDQIHVPVLENDTPSALGKRVLEAEHKLLPAVISKLLTKNNN